MRLGTLPFLAAPLACLASELPRSDVDLFRDVAGVVWSHVSGTPNEDWINQIVTTRDGGFVAVGFVDRSPDRHAPANWDAIVLKFDMRGGLSWSRRLGGEGLDAAWSVVELADGTLAAAGFSSTDSAGQNDAYLVLLEPDGSSAKELRFGGPGEDRATDIVAMPDGGLLLVGQSADSGHPDVLLVRTDRLGRAQWQRTYGGPEIDRGFFAVSAPDGGAYVSGVRGAEGNYDILAMRVDREGEPTWEQRVGGPANDPSHGITLLGNGNVLVVGYTASWGARGHDAIALTFSPAGALLRHEVAGGAGDDRIMRATAASDGGAWLVGSTRSFGAGDWDILVAKIDERGRFGKQFATLGTGHPDQGTSIRLRGDGSLLVGGMTSSASQGESPADLLIARIEPQRLLHWNVDTRTLAKSHAAAIQIDRVTCESFVPEAPR